MPRYYLHVERDGERIADEEGCEASDDRAVQAIAVTSIADLAAEDLKRGMQVIEQFITVENESREQVLRVRIVASIDVQAPDRSSQLPTSEAGQN